MTQPQTFAELQACLLAWLDDAADAVNPSECIGLAEARLSRLLNVPEMEASTVLALSGGSAALPADCRQVRGCAIVGTPDCVLEPSTAAALQRAYSAGCTGMPLAYAVSGVTLLVAPVPDTAATVRLTYKQAIPALSDANPANWLLAKHPDLYVAASLAMAEFRGWNDARLPLLKEWYDELLDEVNEAGRQARHGGGAMRMRAWPPVAA